MRFPRRALLFFCVLWATTCTGDDPVHPPVEAPLAPSASLGSELRAGNPLFSFLPPLERRRYTAGAFSGALLPDVFICLLDEPGGECEASQPAGLPHWPAGTVGLSRHRYRVFWDTDDPQWSPLDPSRYYRITVRVGGVELGHVDVDPWHRGRTFRGRVDDQLRDDVYPIEIGRVVPIMFWIGVGALCDSDDKAVIECTEQAIVDESGGTVRLTRKGEALAVTIPPNSLPSSNSITVVLERLDPALLGERCLPHLDAPQFGPCFRIRAMGLEGPLTHPAVVSICAEPPAFGLPEGQDALQIHRYGDDGFIYGLANTPTMDCAEEVGLLRVPEAGPMRYAARAVNGVARFLGPQPLRAAHLGLGGLTSSFSRFRWALPGTMAWEDPSVVIGQDTSPIFLPASIRVVDEEGRSVAGATVHFEKSIGSVSAASAVTGPDGRASIVWNLGTPLPGQYTLTAHATGLWEALRGHTTGFLADRREVTLTVTISGGE